MLKTHADMVMYLVSDHLEKTTCNCERCETMRNPSTPVERVLYEYTDLPLLEFLEWNYPEVFEKR